MTLQSAPRASMKQLAYFKKYRQRYTKSLLDSILSRRRTGQDSGSRSLILAALAYIKCRFSPLILPWPLCVQGERLGLNFWCMTAIYLMESTDVRRLRHCRPETNGRRSVAASIL